eukprot:1447733-Lingulodinium_polyedra.AAC.1
MVGLGGQPDTTGQDDACELGVLLTHGMKRGQDHAVLKLLGPRQRASQCSSSAHGPPFTGLDEEGLD